MGTNSTRGFHRESPIDLMKELTICESLAGSSSPHAKALGLSRGYGSMLGDFLVEKGLLRPGTTVLEAGGGYGTLMSGLLSSHGNLVQRAIMMELSPMLIKRQRLRLRDHLDKVSFIQADIHDLPCVRGGLDLMIVNEVIGDLDVSTGLDPQGLTGEASAVIGMYGLEMPERGRFNLNTGAIRLVETICRLNVPAFISEHSCDPIIPAGLPYLARGLLPCSFPREIRLHAHNEYTIRFSHLIRVAQALGKTTQTGPLIDLLGGEEQPCWRFIFTSGACSTEKQELVYEFLDHVREYRWLIIT